MQVEFSNEFLIVSVLKCNNFLVYQFKRNRFWLLAFLMSSCIEFGDSSEIPRIAFKSAQSDIVFDVLGNESKHTQLVFDIVDGDGNFGLLPSDTLDPFIGHFRHNFYFDLMVKSHSEFVPWSGLAINYFDIPYVVPQGQNKLLDARVTIDLFFPKALLPFDTLYYRFYVYDREFNRSNIDSSYVVMF